MDDSSLQPDAPDIMIVDDSVDNLSLLTRILHRRGYQVRAYTSGGNSFYTNIAGAATK